MTRSRPALLSPSRWSLRTRLVLAFWLVSVIPTMIAAELAANTLSHIFESNVRIWLRESTRIVEDEISEVQQENARAARLFLAYLDVTRDTPAQHDRRIADLADAVGIDIVALIRNSDQQPVFSTASADAVAQISLAPTAVLQILHLGANRVGAVVSSFATRQGGVDYRLLIATYLDSRFLTNVADVHSLDLRLYLSDQDGFTEVVSTQRFENHPLRLPLAVEQALRKTGGASEQSSVRYSGVYSPIFNDEGEMRGVVFSGLMRYSNLFGMVNQSNLFALILLVGSALSLSVGWFVSQRLTRPLRGLSAGVRAVTAGHYGQKVEVLGNDELADLSQIFNHMTERLRELQDLEAQLRRRERLHTLGEVAMGLAHEIRNPLGIIKTATQLLHRRATLPDSDLRHLEYVISEVTRINDLISDFLEFARPGTPTRACQKARPLLDDLLGFCAPQLQARHIEARIVEDDPGAMIYVDGRQLTQACLNLVLNAIDAMPDGGQLTLGIASDGPWTLIRVTDTGLGIEADMLERIFTPFVTTKASGIGLGLAKVYAIMENHDGRIECTSRPGQGATFTLYLPGHEPGRAGAAQEDSHEP